MPLHCSTGPSDQLEKVAQLLASRRFAVLTGAGISTESGIPDYRGPSGRQRPRRSIQYRPFVDQASVRARYWARSAVGWPRFRAFLPNPAHRALAQLEDSGWLTGLITQNVDRLHLKAGQRRQVELHGALAEVCCLQCRARLSRDDFQNELMSANPTFDPSSFVLAPDGDADLSENVGPSFEVPGCGRCGGILKPDVVFFGESVPPPRVAEAFAVVDAAEALLIVGTSLAIHSGFRFLRHAVVRGMPVALINLGPCRGAELVQAAVDGPAGEVLPALARRLLAVEAPPSLAGTTTASLEAS